MHWFPKALLWLAGIAVAGALALMLTVAVALAMAYPNLPDVSELADYRPKLPLRVYSSEGALLGEFGEERRTLTPIQDIPKVMTDAVIADQGLNGLDLERPECGCLSSSLMISLG